MCLSYEQFRKFVFGCLGKLLCVKCVCSPGAGDKSYKVETDDTVLLDAPNMFTGVCNRRPNESPSSSSSAPQGEAAERVERGTEPVLADIRDLLQSIVSTMSRQRSEKERDEQLMKDWMLAAAIVDRFLFIIIVLFFVGGTLTFIILFASLLR